ncbi:MAG: cyanophycinase [Sulfolobales archaeon]
MRVDRGVVVMLIAVAILSAAAAYGISSMVRTTGVVTITEKLLQHVTVLTTLVTIDRTTVTVTSTQVVKETTVTTATTTAVATVRVSPPVSPLGTLVIMGGRTFDEAFLEVLRATGREKPRVGIIPTASSTPEETGREYVEMIKGYGAEGVLIDITERNCAKTAYEQQYVELVKSLDAVFFTGGDQNRITKCLLPGGSPTPVLEALWNLYLRGGVISGNSAGAAIMSDPMIGGGMDERVIVTRGLGFLMYGQVIVDQHFLARGRVLRLIEALIQTGIRLGIGIDEGAALVCFGNFTCRVIGSAPVVVFVYEGYNGTHHIFSLSYLTPGDSIDLKTLKVDIGSSKKSVLISGDTTRTADIDVKTQNGLSVLIGLLTRNKEVSVGVLSESRRFTYQITLARTSRTKIYETGFYDPVRYTAIEVSLYITKK